MKITCSERGSSMAWTAVFLITVLLPLMLLVVDGSRLFYIRGRLQTATDAACEDAAWAAGDRPIYIDTGDSRIGNEGYAVQVAQSTFASTLKERDRVSFSSQFSISFDHSTNQVLCSAVAQVPVLFSAVGVAPQVDVPTRTSAAIRFR
jgi:uncharacterized membrane protein